MGEYVVAISIDKVQAFLYYMLQAQVQENQTNSGTLRDIVKSSNLISKQLYLDIGLEGDGAFSGHITDRLLVCSGMCIFTASLEEHQILTKLDRLFKTYYEMSTGQLLVKYVCFEKEISRDQDKLEAIKESKHRLRQQDCLNRIIDRHRALLFQFCSVPVYDPLKQSIVSDQEYEAFSPTINALYSEENADNDNHFRIAVIKADLDGMGALFERIEQYTEYEAVSNLLSRFICLNSLHEKTREYQNKDAGFKLYPLYMAGDDIFFAVAASRLLDGVNLCKDILRQLNDEITKWSKAHDTELAPLSMSVGIDFTFNREPIRYYYERVQHQVDCAKAAPSLQKGGAAVKASCVKVCVNEYVFYDFDMPKKDKDHYEDIPKWRYFIHDVKRLKGAMQQGFAAYHFFYGLLNKITDRTICSSNIKYSNAVLYHVLPQHLNSQNKELREFELLNIESILKQFLVKKQVHGSVKKPQSKNKKPEYELCFGAKAQRNRLEKYVRLLLLFSDQRFGVTGSEVTIKEFVFDKKRVRSTLFNKTLRYLYDHNLHGTVRGFREIFVKRESYEGPNGSRRPVQVYRTLRISSSMFHRLKKTDKIDIEKTAGMIQTVNQKTKEETGKLETERKEEKKAPPGLFFDKEAFCRIAHRTNLWTKDYIDTLLIFYQFNELSIQYKSLYPSDKQNASGGIRK
ncbi:hypothetical protein [Paenibacillus sp. MSJ-34]|uniref:Cas10/Cmr2 second palm domain-containing protein n=1 Tax=Paenibacillus sp. MSJ-34 TaxID=2841529 RepID=UPI001C0FFC0E|nr:hypothetical protein [Paenibacillus sp. MSJ-34]MBU5442523.1 hypothetical protein [Paenibacillus sp. MSJ-34]